MNFYDKVHELVKELKNTEEYITYIQMKEQIKQNPEAFKKVKEFIDKQREQQMQYISGKEMTEGDKQYMQNLYSIIIQDQAAAKFFDAEIKLNVLLADIQKILGEGIKDAFEL